VRALPLVVLAAGLLACQPPLYSIPGERERPAIVSPVLTGTGGLSQGHPRPLLRVQPAGALGRLPKRGLVVYHGPSNKRGVQLLKLELGVERTVSVLYTPPAEQLLPVEVDQEIRVALTPPDQESAFRGEGLVVFNPEGTLIAAIAAGGGLPPDVLGINIEIGPSPRLAYSEVRPLPNLCLAMIAHRYLRVAIEGRVAHLRPGSWSPLQIQGRVYRLFALDVAEPADERCGPGTQSSLTFAIFLRP